MQAHKTIAKKMLMGVVWNCNNIKKTTNRLESRKRFNNTKWKTLQVPNLFKHHDDILYLRVP